MTEPEVPVYLFTGFLESGKTTFIQGTLADPRFNAGEPTLVLLCEEGEVELDTGVLRGKITVEVIDDEDLINPVNLQVLLKKAGAERVMIEYNGMWMLDTLFAAMPENWVIYQEFSFYDSATFIPYNTNMRQLVYNKLQTADCVVFNRFGDEFDKMEFHKIVRGASRRCDIVYEWPDGETELDDIEDPLPFDLEAPVIQIEDRDYALWYRDMGAEMEKYQDKVVRFKGITGRSKTMFGGDFIIGREVMTCCVEDIQMAGLVCRWNGPRPQKSVWLWITARIDIKKHPAYGNKTGPVLIVQKIENAEEPEQTVATFY